MTVRCSSVVDFVHWKYNGVMCECVGRSRGDTYILFVDGNQELFPIFDRNGREFGQGMSFSIYFDLDSVEQVYSDPPSEREVATARCVDAMDVGCKK